MTKSLLKCFDGAEHNSEFLNDLFRIGARDGSGDYVFYSCGICGASGVDFEYDGRRKPEVEIQFSKVVRDYFKE